ncbi:hypothetical protein PV325_001715 [Microctonus aethiopoides]|nr:hypothetical protein PV325_001715 [Microctonus aethiopoides]
MTEISEIECFPLKSCCMHMYSTVDGDVVRICKETQQRYSVWVKERQHRFTGSTCYGRELSGKTVIETGLIVSKCNPWLAVSPDGVIFKTMYQWVFWKLNLELRSTISTSSFSYDI